MRQSKKLGPSWVEYVFIGSVWEVSRWLLISQNHPQKRPRYQSERTPRHKSAAGQSEIRLRPLTLHLLSHLSRGSEVGSISTQRWARHRSTPSREGKIVGSKSPLPSSGVLGINYTTAAGGFSDIQSFQHQCHPGSLLQYLQLIYAIWDYHTMISCNTTQYHTIWQYDNLVNCTIDPIIRLGRISYLQGQDCWLNIRFSFQWDLIYEVNSFSNCQERKVQMHLLGFNGVTGGVTGGHLIGNETPIYFRASQRLSISYL